MAGLSSLANAATPDEGLGSAQTAEPTATDVPFIDATVATNYTDSDVVSEGEGDAQQQDALAVDLQRDVDSQSTRAIAGEIDVNIARIDLSSDNVLVAATWDLDAPEPAVVSLRYLQDSVWSLWIDLEPASSDGPQGEITARAGTESFSLFNAEAVEVVAVDQEGVSAPGLRVVVIEGDNDGPVENVLTASASDELDNEISDEDEVADVEPGQSEDSETEVVTEDTLLDEDGLVEAEHTSYSPPSNLTFAAGGATTGVVPTALNAAGTTYDTGFSGLKINTRKAWGADESKMTWTPKANKIQGAVIHHTESSNNYTQDQVAQQIRNIYHYHAVTLGWGDIGYNVIVDKFGGVWEGRAGGLTNQIHAAHAGNANGATFGITVMGGYMNDAPAAATLDSVAKTIAWKLQLHGIKSVDRNISVLHQSGQYVSVPVVSAHRDVGWTDCPGDAFYARVPSVRIAVANYLKASTVVTPPSTSSGTFNPENVISDARFYNPNAMSEVEIQNFIVATGKDCKPDANTTCLKDTKFPTQNLKTLRGGCQPLNLEGSQSPWVIVDRTAKACGLSPEVILVTLQKEQSGLTQPKPASTWAKAMGSGCPDGSGCDAAQAGFQKQVYYGADKLVSYKIKSQAGHVDAFTAGQAKTVLHNPDTSCGSVSLKFANVATASLYEYTPYIGNAGKSGCSTIGQKMFWDLMQRYFPDKAGGGTVTPTPIPPNSTTGTRIQQGTGWPLDRTIYPGDMTGDGVGDMMLVDASGLLWIYPGKASGGYQQRQQIGHGWKPMNAIFGGVDWNGDGKNDLIARHSDGRLILYAGTGTGRIYTWGQIGHGWQKLDNLMAFNHPTGPIIYGTLNNSLYKYPGTGRGGFRPQTIYGTGWDNMSGLTAVGDWTGDGYPDVVARTSAGYLRLYQTNNLGNIFGGVNLSGGWNEIASFGGQNSRKANSGLMAVDKDKKLWRYQANGFG